ncbi:MAG: Fructose-1,6-bisphosphatase/inositol-1-monophosphatase [Phycisphaerae bacterium]|nr:Fructose-1,6-bisphosphatase/inositol-1-monophosphatase [Phycisphaerae bacterium]
MTELQKYLNFAREQAHLAGRLTLGYFHRPLAVESKADDSPVTVADRQAEQLLRAAIEQHYPDHGIVGEEYGRKDPRPGCSYCWYIDPIDGTKSFVRGVPLYTTLLALVREERSVIGVIDLPPLGEQLAAADGLGCHLNGRVVRCSTIHDISRAVGLTTDMEDLVRAFPDRRWQDIWSSCAFRRSWSDAYGHYLVATGRAEFMLDPLLSPHDCAALPVIFREAGGTWFDWTGRESIFSGNGISCTAALEPALRQALCRTG